MGATAQPLAYVRGGLDISRCLVDAMRDLSKTARATGWKPCAQTVLGAALSG
jgi:hypothetical protein